MRGEGLGEVSKISGSKSFTCSIAAWISPFCRREGKVPAGERRRTGSKTWTEFRIETRSVMESSRTRGSAPEACAEGSVTSRRATITCPRL